MPQATNPRTPAGVSVWAAVRGAVPAPASAPGGVSGQKPPCSGAPKPPPYPRAFVAEDELRLFAPTQGRAAARKRPAPRDRGPMWLQPPPLVRSRLRTASDYMSDDESMFDLAASPDGTAAKWRRQPVARRHPLMQQRTRQARCAWRQLNVLETAAGDARTGKRLRDRAHQLEAEATEALLEVRLRAKSERQHNKKIHAALMARTPAPTEKVIRSWIGREEMRFRELEYLATLRLEKALKDAEEEETAVEMSHLPVPTGGRARKRPPPPRIATRAPRNKASKASLAIADANVVNAIRSCRSQNNTIGVQNATDILLGDPLIFPSPFSSSQ